MTNEIMNNLNLEELIIGIQNQSRGSFAQTVKEELFRAEKRYEGAVKVWGIIQEAGLFKRIAEGPNATEYYTVRLAPLTKKAKSGMPLLATINVFKNEDPLLFETCEELVKGYPNENLKTIGSRKVAIFEFGNEKAELEMEYAFYAVESKEAHKVWIPNLFGEGKGGYQAESGVTPDPKKDYKKATTYTLGIRAIPKGSTLKRIIGRELTLKKKHLVNKPEETAETIPEE